MVKLDMHKLLSNYGEWLNAAGENSNIVISNRIRLARNIVGFPFPHRASDEDLEGVLKKIVEIVSKSSSLSNATVSTMATLPPLYREILLERHLISPDQTQNKRGSVIIGEKERISIMVSEEDHLRIQGMSSGLNFSSTWQMLSKLDDELAGGLSYATSLHYGYLTSCPTNIGTGLRASAMVHLAGLCFSKQIGKLLQAVAQLGLAIRGIHGEGTEALGELFQISNQVTLGRTEEEIIDNIERICRQIITHEQNARESLLKKARATTEDKIYRAYGDLLWAKLISSKEALKLLSIVRLGVGLNLLNIPMKVLNELLILIHPAHIQFRLTSESKGGTLRDIRDSKRAELIQQKLKEATNV